MLKYCFYGMAIMDKNTDYGNNGHKKRSIFYYYFSLGLNIENIKFIILKIFVAIKFLPDHQHFVSATFQDLSFTWEMLTNFSHRLLQGQQVTLRCC